MTIIPQEIHGRRAYMQAKTIERLERTSDPLRGKVEAFPLPDGYATEPCSCGTCDELGTVCGPEWFGYELGLTCALRAIETWLSDPHHGPREVLTLEVKL